MIFPSTAAKSVGVPDKVWRDSQEEAGEVKQFRDADTDKARAIVEKARKNGQTILAVDDVYGILTAYGIPVAEWRVVKSADEAVSAARNRFPSGSEDRFRSKCT